MSVGRRRRTWDPLERVCGIEQRGKVMVLERKRRAGLIVISILQRVLEQRLEWTRESRHHADRKRREKSHRCVSVDGWRTRRGGAVACSEEIGR